MPLALTVLLVALAVVAGLSLRRTAQLRPVAFFADESLTLVIRQRGQDHSPTWLVRAPSVEPTFLPNGEFDVQTLREGALGSSFILDLRGDTSEQAEITVDVDSSQFSSPLYVAEFPAVVDLGERRALLAFTRSGVELWRQDESPTVGRTWRTAWSVDLDEDLPQELAPYPGWDWASRRLLEDYVNPWDKSAFAPFVVAQYVDLDGDQVGDVVIAGQHQAFLCAMSGASGRILWFAGRGDELKESRTELRRDADTADDSPNVHSSILDSPLVVGDIDGDAVVDFLVNVVRRGSENPRHPGRQSLEVISGGTGRSVWEFAVPDAWRIREPEHDLDQNRSRTWDVPDSSGMEVGFPASLIRCGDDLALAFTIGSTIHRLELATGRECDEPYRICPSWSGEPVWGDVDGDRFDDVVVAFRAPLGSDDDPANQRGDDGLFLRVHSLHQDASLWQTEVGTADDWASLDFEPAPRPLPLVVDLDGDGQCEVLVVRPAANPLGARGCHELFAWQGATGRVLWSRRFPASGPPNHSGTVLAGPDIDRDGQRDVFWANRSDGWNSFVLDAISGATGASIWNSRSENWGDPSEWKLPCALAKLGWWRSGLDGWPQIYLLSRPLKDTARNAKSSFRLATFSAGTGRSISAGTKITNCEAVDLDHDGQEELLTFWPHADTRQRRVEITSGAASAWKCVSITPSERLPDLDGDHIAEIATFTTTLDLSIRSGRTGESLSAATAWTLTESPTLHKFRPVRISDLRPPGEVGSTSRPTQPTPFVDLNGDGAADALFVQRPNINLRNSPLQLTAVSGKSGRVLWIARLLDDAPWSALQWLGADDFDGDGTPDLLALREGHTKGDPNAALVSGRSGRVLWSSDTSSPVLQDPRAPPGVFDGDADSRPDVLLMKQSTSEDGDAVEWRALRGRDGVELWRRTFTLSGVLWRRGLESQGDFSGVVPVASHASQPAYVVVWFIQTSRSADQSPPNGCRWRFEALDARNGSPLWTWEHPDEFSLSDGGIRRLEIVAWRHDSSESRLAVWMPADPRSWWEIDARGAAQRIPMPITNVAPPLNDNALEWPHANRQARLWSVDLDQNGRDELLAYDRGIVTAFDPRDSRAALWSSSMSMFGDRGKSANTFPDLVSKLNSPGLPWLVGGNATGSSVVGINLSDGREVWRCPIPRGFNTTDLSSLSSVDQGLAVLGNVSTEHAPFILFRNHEASLIRQATWAAVGSDATRTLAAQRTPDPRWLDDDWRAWGLTPRMAASPPLHDSRWGRVLPWVPTDAREWAPPSYDGPLAFLGFLYDHGRIFFLACGYFVAPGWYLARTVRRRQFTLRQWLLLPLVVALLLTVWRMSATTAVSLWMGRDSESWLDALVWHRWPNGIALAAIYAAPIGWMLTLSIAAARGRWRTIGMALALWGVACVAVALAAVVMDKASQPFWPDEFYDWAGWPWIGWDGAIVGGWAYVLLAPVLKVAKWLRGVRGTSPQQAPHGTRTK